MRPRVKFTDKGQPLVVVSYKTGQVTWGLDIGPHGKFNWFIYDKAPQYSPARIKRDHEYILSGKKLRAQLIAKAAASHSFTALAKLKQSKV